MDEVGMGEAIGQVLPLGVGVTLSPLPIIAVVLMLGTPRARSNGIAFVVGWIVGLAVVGSVVLLLAGGAGASEDGEPATWVSWVKLVLGLLLLVLAVRKWRTRPRGDGTDDLPGWMKALDTFTAPKSLGIAAVLSGVNPKNLMLTVAAAAAIAQTGIDTGQQFAALAVFVVIGAIGPGVPVAMYLVMGARAERLLAELKEWMGAHTAAIMTVLLLVLGAKLTGDAISGLVG
jgi:hypothetical protein